MYLDSKLAQSVMGEIVVVSDCRFTLLELTVVVRSVVVVPVLKDEWILSTASEASDAVLAFVVACSCFSLASAIASLAALILDS